MSFWCSVSDRCSGKIGEGEVPPTRLQLCLLSLFGTKGSCHICHDWCGCRRIVRAYLHETPKGETSAGWFVLPLFALHTPQLTKHTSCNTTPIGLHFWEWYITPERPFGHFSQHIPHYHMSSLSKPALGKITNISTRLLSLMFVSSSYHSEMLMTNDVLRRNHFTVLDNKDY